MDLKSRAVPVVLIGGVVLAGGGAVLAAAGGSASDKSAAKAQYCPNGGHGKKCKPKKPKKTKLHTHQRHAHRCYASKFTMKVVVSNKAKGRRTFVYHDGHRIRKTRHNHFTVRINVKHLKRGVHHVKVRVRDKHGHWITHNVRFRRC